MSTISHDYYAILGVAKDATLDEIKGQYKRLMKENHPDQYNGLKAKYEHDDDKTLQKVLEEKIKEAEEFCKNLNDAFEVLTDPARRKQYDEQVFESKVEEPKISVSPKTISFGTLKDGEKKASTFTIRNDGGSAASVNIDWQGAKPVWGGLIIEPDENNVFPIKVTVSVNTTGIPSGVKDDKILVTVDGKGQIVEVFLSVARTVAPVASIPATASSISAPVPTPPVSKPTGIKSVIIVCLVIGSIVLVRLLSGGSVSTPTVQVAPIQVATVQNEPNRALATQLADNFATQNAPASREDLEGELSAFEKNPNTFVSVRRVGAGTQTDTEKRGLYEVKNNSKFSWVTADCGVLDCSSVDYYNSVALLTMENQIGNTPPLYPGEVRQLNVLEYDDYLYGWAAEEVCINVNLSNQTGDASSKFCFDPLINYDLSQFVHIIAKLLPTNSKDYSGLLEITFQVDEAIPSLPVLIKRPYGPAFTMTPEVGPGASSSEFYFLQQDETDSRVLVDMNTYELLPGKTIRYLRLRDNYQPSSICIVLTDAYAADANICSSVQ